MKAAQPGPALSPWLLPSRLLWCGHLRESMCSRPLWLLCAPPPHPAIKIPPPKKPHTPLESDSLLPRPCASHIHPARLGPLPLFNPDSSPWPKLSPPQRPQITAPEPPFSMNPTDPQIHHHTPAYCPSPPRLGYVTVFSTYKWVLAPRDGYLTLQKPFFKKATRAACRFPHQPTKDQQCSQTPVQQFRP